MIPFVYNNWKHVGTDQHHMLLLVQHLFHKIVIHYCILTLWGYCIAVTCVEDHISRVSYLLLFTIYHVSFSLDNSNKLAATLKIQSLFLWWDGACIPPALAAMELCTDLVVLCNWWRQYQSYLGKCTAGFSSNCVHTLLNSVMDEVAPSVAR